MKYYIFRNSTIENLFSGLDANFSGYGDITVPDVTADVYVWFYLPTFKADLRKTAEEISVYYETLQFIHSKIPENKTFLIFTLQNIFELRYLTGDFLLNKSIENFNTQTEKLASQYSNIKIIDFARFTKNYASEQLIDWKYYFISKMQINPRIAKDFKKWFAKEINAVLLKRKKCIVLDLDNTLWGGVLGEDGISGIQIGGDYPGNAFLMFQEFLVELGKNGVILTLCSKNNEQDVLELWAKNPFIVLKEEHIAAYRINWNNKAQNIQELADELNIGLDSMVFIDDNPSERALVRQTLPMVTVAEFPEQPYLLPVFMEQLLRNEFAVYALTNEDTQKTAQYKANAERAQEQKKFVDFDEYLQSLAMELTIEAATPFTVSRIAQMTQKTNQFNLTTKRYTENDIQNFLNAGNPVYSLSVKDKFGDNGITGAIILKKINEISYEIDSFLLSCRILGKNIEEAFLYNILDKLKKQGIKEVQAQYIPTAKNEQVKDFYDKMGFQQIDKKQDCLIYKTDIFSRDFTVKHFYIIHD
ncbi:MAG: HAD-IIIC family phosphatase [Prevotellaceae bacterium]|jgi:FkbH-like protein|nr:HAD-IIIC family phosphatase [Prevotellaceae bacterium]